MGEQNKMVSVLWSVVIPLFNVNISTDGHKTLEFTWKPTQTALQDIILDNLTITLFKWDSKDNVPKEILEKYCHTESFPEKFDFFDAFPQRYASAMLIVQVCELYPPSPGQDILAKLSNSFYADQIIRSFQQSLKLCDDTEPHFYKGYYFKNGVNTGTIIHWPIKEMQGPPMQIDKGVFDSVNKLFFDLLTVNEWRKDSVGNRVIRIAMKYYGLSSRQTEYDVIFLFLMISFEALFKKSNNESVSKAIGRFGRLLADSKGECSQLKKFMSQQPKHRGCCYLRNAIVHGDENASSIKPQTFWDLKRYMRKAIVRIVDATTKSKLDETNYYDSLEQYVNSRFENLPTK